MNAFNLIYFRCIINAFGTTHELVIRSTEYDIEKEAKRVACSIFNANGFGSSHAISVKSFKKTNQKILQRAANPSSQGKAFKSLDNWVWIL